MSFTSILLSAEESALPLERIGERFSSLRIINPAADQAIFRSMGRYGQITPVVVSEIERGHYELLDGFKRLRSARGLSMKSLAVRPLRLNIRAGKAAIMQLNWVGKSINSMEEALVVHSLFHEDNLAQVEIATLLDRHKSWVCRRIALIDRLCDEGQDCIKLGLLPISMARELTKLPRGNQEEVIEAVRKHQLTCRETRILVEALQARPEHEYAAILRSPWELLPPREHEDTSVPNRLCPLARDIYRKLINMERCCRIASFAVQTTEFGQFEEVEERVLLALCEQTLEVVEQTDKALRRIILADSETGQ